MGIRCSSEECFMLNKDHYNFCAMCGEALDKSVDLSKLDLEGFWTVSTYGDCEGKTTNDLGTVKGHFNDVIAYFSSKSYYKIWLTKVAPPNYPELNNEMPTSDSVIVTNKINGKERSLNVWRAIAKERGWRVEEGPQYNCVKVVFNG